MLQKLILRTKGMERIAAAAFCGLSQLLEMKLGHNKLTSAPHLCPVKRSLENLYLENNEISTISENYLKGFEKLKVFHLSNNNIILLPDLHWVQHSLFDVRAEYDYVTSLEAFQTSDIFQQLHLVYMGGNNIRNFNISLLCHMPKLYQHQLYTNEITHVDDFRNFSDKDIRMVNNPWHCGAALSWMGEDDMKFEHRLRCATPVCRRGVAIANMSKLKKPRILNTLWMRWNGRSCAEDVLKFNFLVWKFKLNFSSNFNQICSQLSD